MYRGNRQGVILMLTNLRSLERKYIASRRAGGLRTRHPAKMEKHAMAILNDPDSWSWPNKKIDNIPSGKFENVAPVLLCRLIVESQKLGGEVLNQFWYQLGTCDETLKQNSM